MTSYNNRMVLGGHHRHNTEKGAKSRVYNHYLFVNVIANN